VPTLVELQPSQTVDEEDDDRPRPPDARGEPLGQAAGTGGSEQRRHDAAEVRAGVGRQNAFLVHVG
jgi:hypothetical protein